MHILVSNHAAEIAAFRSAIGPGAAWLQVVENNLSALSLIGNRHEQIDSLVITEHQDQAVNVDTEVFVQNIVPRLMGSTDVIVLGALLPSVPGVQLVETISEAAAIVARQPEAVAAPAYSNGHAKVAIDALEVYPAADGSRSSKKRNNRRASEQAPSLDPQLAATTEVAEETPPAEAPSALPDRPKAPKAVPEQPETPPVAKTEAPSALPDRPETPDAPPRPFDNNKTVLLLPRVDDEAAYVAPSRAATPPVPPVQSAPPAKSAPAQPVPPELPMPQVMHEIPETTRSLADDIRDWNEHQDEQRSQARPPEPRQQSISELLLSWLPSNRRLREQENTLDATIRQPRLTRCQSVAVISPKGGVGKSFLTYLVGNFLAEVRGDKVIAIDTNPDFGTLADQVRGREEQTVSTLLEQINDIRHYSDMRRFTSKVQSRLEVLAAPADPDMMATITANDYGRVFEQLHHYYDTVMFDCGTGFRDDITRFALQTADQIVLVSAPLFITTGIVIRAIGYLDQIGCDLSRVTLAINQVRSEKPLDIDYMRSRFGSRLNAIVEVPFDMQLYQAMDRGEFNVETTQQSTRIAVKQLVGELVRHFE